MNRINDMILKRTQRVRTNVIKYSPEILTSIGIAGMVSSTILAVMATPKAHRLLEEEEKRRLDEGNEEVLNAKDIVTISWKCYIPAAVTGVVSGACIICANTVNSRRRTALAAAYAISETSMKEYRNKVKEVVGDKKEQQVQDAVAKDKIERNPVDNNSIIITNSGDTLCYDALSGRYFKSDIEKLKKIENNLNRNMRDSMFISLNDLYDEMGLGYTSIGDDIGWHIDHGYIDMVFSSQLASNGSPCLVINYRVQPRTDFWKN